MQTLGHSRAADGPYQQCWDRRSIATEIVLKRIASAIKTAYGYDFNLLHPVPNQGWKRVEIRRL
jgi:hypothetical protein